ncbi:LysE family translocator [Aureimonas altamirensis]|uniref:LysE family translocator n=1 Tax=Aureimonas altamirensis TaxID=370622 RepID=UPI001E2CE61C|nr:LysE family translocator [Aureimonas altamirensis]UHD46617.1 LysE family translocator [Aureimonas altamirensis]
MTFLPDATALASFAVASLVLAVTPGPDMVLFLSRTIAQGRKAGFACMFGALTGIMIHTALVALGLAALLAASPKAFAVLKLAGVAYLIFLAVQAVRNGSAPAIASGRSTYLGFSRNWRAGLAVNLLNPKVILFFLTFLPQFVAASDPHAAAKLAFLGLMFVAIGLCVCIGVILMADRVALLLRRSPKVSRALDWLFASVFSAFAVKLMLARA